MSVVNINQKWKRQFTRDEIVIYAKDRESNLSDTICRIHFPMEGMCEASKLRALDKASLIVAAPDLLDTMKEILLKLESNDIQPEVTFNIIRELTIKAITEAEQG